MAHTQLKHRVEYSSLYRFQAVARVREGASDDDAHRVIEITLLYLLFQRQSYDLVDLKKVALLRVVIHIYTSEALYVKALIIP